MRFYHVALFTFVFNLVLGLISQIGTNVQYNIPSAGWNVSAETFNISARPSTIAFGFGDFFRALSIFENAFLNATFLLPKLLTDIGFPIELVTVITAILWMVYGAGIIQFLGKISLKEME